MNFFEGRFNEFRVMRQSIKEVRGSAFRESDNEEIGNTLKEFRGVIHEMFAGVPKAGILVALGPKMTHIL